MKIKILSMLCFLLVDTAFCQSENVDWKVEQIHPGMVWRSFHFDTLDQFRQFVSLLEIDLGHPDLEVDLAFGDSSLMSIEALAESKEALAAINGTFFNMREGGSVKYLKVDGTIINEVTSRDGSDFAGEGAVVVTSDKNVDIIPRQYWWKREVVDPYEDLMASGPLMLLDGKTRDIEQDAFNLNRHPRTACCITSADRLIFITVDGRSEQSAGMSIPELSAFMQDLGCVDALNLDGGGSTTMWIDGRGVVNHPSDNKQFDHQGARKVANVVLVKRRGN